MPADDSVARYSMWLFSRYEEPGAVLAEIYDLVKTKNPVSAQDFTYPMFLQVFETWQQNQRNKPIKVKMSERLAANPPTLGVIDSEKLNVNTSTVVISTEPNKNSTPAEVIPAPPQPTPSVGMVAGVAAPRVIDYRIINEFILERFVELVHVALREGWQPLGGITRSVSGGGGTGYYMQAMVKYADAGAESKPDVNLESKKESKDAEKEIIELRLEEDAKGKSDSGSKSKAKTKKR